MSDTYRYFNKNNGDVLERPHKVAKCEMYQNWVRVKDDDHLAELQADNERNGRGNLLGSSSVGDRKETRHQVPDTFQPRIEYTEPSKTQLPGQHPEPEEFHKEDQPYVVTVDPSQQTEPIAGEGKRDLSAVVLDETLDTNPASQPIGSGAEDGVLARAHPELEGVEDRRQQLIQDGGSGPDRPARSAPKSEWIDWAVKNGASRADAGAMTKTELIDTYGE